MPPIEPTLPPDQPISDSRTHNGELGEDPGYELLSEDEVDRWSSPQAGRPIPIAHMVSHRRLSIWVRLMLVLIALGFVAIFAIAAWLNPYDAEGNPRTMATHTQLGLPPCNMVTLIGKPCPACGMTTSFSLLIHADPVASLQANWAGTFLALFWLSLIPWAAVCAFRGKYYFIHSGEALVTAAVIMMLILMLSRWGIVLLN